MAVIGQPLTAPEAGWKRYDERDSRIKFSSPNALRQAYTTYGTYAGTLSYIDSGMGNTADTISFKFTGTKLIIGVLYWNTNEHSGFSVEVDGVKLGDYVTGRKSAIAGSTVGFIKTDFEDKEHSVVIKNLDKSVVSGSNSTFALDFIDIDSTGNLVTVVGQPLTSPDTGWRRYDDTHDSFIYLGENWIFQAQSGTPTLYNATHHYSARGMGGNEIRFKFYGTKMRLISSIGPTFADDISVVIDGVTEKFNPRMPTTADERQRLTYEKTNLSLGIHEVNLINGTNGDWRLDIDAVDIDDTGYMVAQVGQRLFAPEPGWKRYDNSNSAIKYEGVGWISATGDSNTYAGTAHYIPLNGASSNSIKFNFYGTKLRIIDLYWTNRVDNVTIEIDGKVSTWNPNNPANKYQILVFEVSGLEKALHKVKLSTTSLSGTFSLDAIDIDLDGRLFHPEEVTSIDELEIGTRIRCNYVANTSGAAGEFKNIGKQTSEFISTSSVPSVPNGDFYLIVADEYNGKKILIADRNIQSSISWDALNSNGLVFGVQKDLGVKNYTLIYRLLTGGIKATDKDNEWDKYIVNSTLNGKIIVGDNNVWNWSGVYTWTSTTNTYNSSNRTLRGNSKNDTLTYTISNNVSHGFRPLVELETLPMFKSFVKHDGAYKRFDTGTLEWNTISATLPSEDTFINDGMDDLSVLDRKNEGFIASMSANGSLGSGKMFKGRIDLKKYFEIINVSVK
ncbi:hypothetical protein [Paenibacillus sp. FSL H8-0283]|uniref:hypothetical protein n=1 Tax=Paenibacillus sp. FSL H8-0283 TaxID=2921383 RepID=UPI003247CED9